MRSLVYVVVSLLAGATGFFIYRQAIGPHVADHVASSSASARQPADSSSADAAAWEAPSELPDFTLVDREGVSRSIRSWPNKSLIVNFWATWCAPCRREIPLLKQIQEEHGDEGFQVVGIAVDFREDVLEYAEEMGINYPLLIGEQDALDAARAFGLTTAALPFTVFTDAQSRIILSHLGEVTEAESKILLDVVRRVNAGELTPAAARAVAAKQLAALEEAEPAA
ncbi:MAG: TlpA disulfide reductase family protein [Gammaproteobacteria bacterium]|nr:hypothetical protein [Gammaproteobacteria bacterium]